MSDMRFSQKMRLIWIDAILDRGRFRRRDLCEAFGVSLPQASLDIQAYRDLHPGKMKYNAHYKGYYRLGSLSAYGKSAQQAVMAAQMLVMDPDRTGLEEYAGVIKDGDKALSALLSATAAFISGTKIPNRGHLLSVLKREIEDCGND